MLEELKGLPEKEKKRIYRKRHYDKWYGQKTRNYVKGKKSNRPNFTQERMMANFIINNAYLFNLEINATPNKLLTMWGVYEIERLYRMAKDFFKEQGYYKPSLA
jgi:hypothetical protein